MMLAGQPRDSVGWGKVCSEAARAIDEDARRYCGTVHEDYSHRRGGYPNCSGGFSFGGGQKASKLSACIYVLELSNETYRYHATWHTTLPSRLESWIGFARMKHCVV